jgi:hypothetical protein
MESRTRENLELLVTGMIYGALLTHQSFSSAFTITPVMGKDGIFRNRITLDGELGDFTVSVKYVPDEFPAEASERS